MAANVLGGENLIVLANTAFELTVFGRDEIASSTGDLNVTRGKLTIVGLSDASVPIRGGTNFYDRLIHVHTGAQLTLSNVTLAGGAAYGGDYGTRNDAESGGAILNEGDLHLERCVISNNFSGAGNLALGNGPGSGAGDGGGIYNSGQLSMVKCQILRNGGGDGANGSAGGNGGGLFNVGNCSISQCTFIGNTSGAGTTYNLFGTAAPGGNGGGIFNGALMTIDDSVIQGNESRRGGDGGHSGSWFGTDAPPGWQGASGGSGGGIYNSGELRITQSFIAGNRSGNGGNGGSGDPGAAGGSGGNGAAICNLGALSILESTIAGNFCGSGGIGGAATQWWDSSVNGGIGGLGGKGGGVFSSGQANIIASTIAHNEGGAGGDGADGSAGPTHFWGGPGGYAFPPNYVGTGGTGGDGGAGGIFNDFSSTNFVTLRNTLVALNFAGSGGKSGLTQASNLVLNVIVPRVDGNADVGGYFTTSGHNLIGRIDDATGLTNGMNGDIAGSAGVPLDPLIAISGSASDSFYLNLLPGSPAIDAGDDGLLDPPFSLSVDARGEPRKFAGHVDIGAVEYNGVVDQVVQKPILRTPLSNSNFKISFVAVANMKFSIMTSGNLIDWTVAGSPNEIAPGLYVLEEARPSLNRFFSAQSR